MERKREREREREREGKGERREGEKEKEKSAHSVCWLADVISVSGSRFLTTVRCQRKKNTFFQMS